MRYLLPLILIAACDPAPSPIVEPTARMWGQLAEGHAFDVTPEIAMDDDTVRLTYDTGHDQSVMVILFAEGGLYDGHHEVNGDNAEVSAAGCWSPPNVEPWVWDEFASEGGYTLDDDRMDLALQWRDGSVAQALIQF